MSAPQNPFAPPRADEGGPQDGVGGFWLEGDVLVAERGAHLPDVCVWSGETTTHRERRKLTWAPLWVLVFAFSPILLFLVWLLARRRAPLDYALGEAARRRRRSANLSAAAAALLGTATIAGGVAAARAQPTGVVGVALGIAGLVLLLVAAIVAAIGGRTVRVVRIDRDHVRLRLRPPAAAAFARAREPAPHGVRRA